MLPSNTTPLPENVNATLPIDICGCACKYIECSSSMVAVLEAHTLLGFVVFY